MDAKQRSPRGGACEPDPRKETERRRDENLRHIGRVIAVMSGKGGVGKSTVAALLALGLARQGLKTGLLDVDFHGPSVPTLLGIREVQASTIGGQLQPIRLGPNLLVMSLGLLLAQGDQAVIWRGPMKIGVINQLLGDVAWGDLDVLVLDCPPGTGDEPLTIGQVVPTAEVVMVGTPQEVAMADVRKAVSFCRQMGLAILGLVETMGTMRCPTCGAHVPLFRAAADARPADVRLLAEVPFDPALQDACDQGRLEAFLDEQGPTAEHAIALAREVATQAPAAVSQTTVSQNPVQGGDGTMRYALPTQNGRLIMHFGHADVFTLIDVENGQVGRTEALEPPAHEPGVLPRWLKEQGVSVIIAGGMGQRAQGLFAENGIQVVVGAESSPAEDLVRLHLAGTLNTGQNVCDH
ncbi:MAG TPA: iron-sulfur cluster carrier protein MrpORP [Phycisphaerae bacterium]|nr:iron-sulfur cluster carrier protein MrpORP [Phycisphaerae bacterium]